MAEVRQALPGRLHLPPTRSEGADDRKYARQEIEYGDSLEGMPPLEVIENRDGELMIFNGVTRATRAHRYHPEETVAVEVIDSLPLLNMSVYRTIEEISHEQRYEE